MVKKVVERLLNVNFIIFILLIITGNTEKGPYLIPGWVLLLIISAIISKSKVKMLMDIVFAIAFASVGMAEYLGWNIWDFLGISALPLF